MHGNEKTKEYYYANRKIEIIWDSIAKVKLYQCIAMTITFKRNKTGFTVELLHLVCLLTLKRKTMG